MRTLGQALDAFHANMNCIKALPIDQLHLRQPLLVNAVADIVNHYAAEGVREAFVRGQVWWEELVTVLQKEYIQVLGSGYFSAALSSPLLPGRIIKVGFKKEDSGAAYIAWCRANQGREGVPVVHDIQRHEGCYTVVMDELKPLCRKDRVNMDRFMHARACLEGDDAVPETSLGETARSIREFFKGVASFDLHDENIMVDKRGNLVITDPVSFSKGDLSSLSIEELKAQADKVRQDKRMEWAIARGRRKAFGRLNPEAFAAQQKRRRKMAKLRRVENKRKALKDLNAADRITEALSMVMPVRRIAMAGLPPLKAFMDDIAKIEQLALAQEANDRKRPVPLWMVRQQAMPMMGRKGQPRAHR